MSIDATQRSGRFAVASPAPATERLPPARAALRHRNGRVPGRREPHRPGALHTPLQAIAAAVALTLMILGSLLLVSLAAAHGGILVPVSKPGFYPQWLSGPTGVLTGWFTAGSHAERVLFTALIATMLVAYVVVVYTAPRLRARWVLAAIVVLHVIFFLSPPLTLSDVFNYLNYGRMEALYHLNPYVTIPASRMPTRPSCSATGTAC
jgi:hypothetical protein